VDCEEEPGSLEAGDNSQSWNRTIARAERRRERCKWLIGQDSRARRGAVQLAVSFEEANPHSDGRADSIFDQTREWQ
jgi:hypothetical protein